MQSLPLAERARLKARQGVAGPMQEAMIVLAEGVSSLRPAGPAEFGTPSGIYGLERLPLVLTFAR